MLLLNYEVRVYTESPQPATDELADKLSKEVDEVFHRVIETLNQDARIHVTVTEV